MGSLRGYRQNPAFFYKSVDSACKPQRANDRRGEIRLTIPLPTEVTTLGIFPLTKIYRVFYLMVNGLEAGVVFSS